MFEEKIVWHEVVTRPLTEAEREEWKEWERLNDVELAFMFDCPMPDDGQEILIATKWGVMLDICCVDEGIYLEYRGDWDDVIAWADMPTYKGGADDGN